MKQPTPPKVQVIIKSWLKLYKVFHRLFILLYILIGIISLALVKNFLPELKELLIIIGGTSILVMTVLRPFTRYKYYKKAWCNLYPKQILFEENRMALEGLITALEEGEKIIEEGESKLSFKKFSIRF